MTKKWLFENWLWVVVIPPKDERSGWTRIIMPNTMKKVFDYFYSKEEQPTYKQASKDLWVAMCSVYAQISKLREIWILKTDRRWTITWTLSDFIS